MARLASTIIVDRGAILDDLELDFGDGFGPVGFAHMTEAQRAHVLDRIPPRTRFTARPLGTLADDVTAVVYLITPEPDV